MQKTAFISKYIILFCNLIDLNSKKWMHVHKFKNQNNVNITILILILYSVCFCKLILNSVLL